MTTTIDLSTVKRPRSRSESGALTFTVAIVSGPDAGRVHTFDASSPRVLIGTSPACGIRLDDPSVSRRHMALTIVGETLQVIDLGSTNGTQVNGVIVKEAYVHGGEAIGVGNTVFSVTRGAPHAADLLQQVNFGNLKGGSRRMRVLYPILELLATTDQPVYFEGEAGVGKSLVARELHRTSKRKDGPFVEVNVITAEEFAAQGLLGQAKGGTLYVRELTTLPTEVQARLLQAIEAKEDVRIVGGTSRNLDAEVSEGRFLERLRFALGHVEIPALRDRQGDVALLARHFWAELSGTTAPLPEDFLPRFEQYAWPGNVRELRAEVSSRITLGEFGDWKPAQSAIPERAAPATNSIIDNVIQRDMPFTRARFLVVKEFEQRYVEHVLERHRGSVTEAARASGVATRYFQLVRARAR